ncbi:MAG TPA: transposase [Blastocatellia bacterium]|nr:transposase [Blastocatellia bacterium]
MRWLNSDNLHAHTADACVQAFFASLKSWRARRKTDPGANPPRRRRRFFRIEYKNSAIRHRDGKLILSNGKGNAPLILDWPFPMPRTLVIRWQGEQYEAIATYTAEKIAEPTGDKTAGVDLGEVHMAVAHDGENCTILNGRKLRSVRQYQNKVKAKLSSKIDTKPRGSQRRRKLIKSKRKQLRKLDNQIRDIQHKQTTALVSTLHSDGVQTVVIGDVRDIRQGLDYGPKANQKIHQMVSGKTRFLLTYKCERRGMMVVLQDEAYTTQTCPACGGRKKPRGREYVCVCGFRYHRDAVGSLNIRQKYLDCGSVVGPMARPTGIRFHPNACVARGLRAPREAAGF